MSAVTIGSLVARGSELGALSRELDPARRGGSIVLLNGPAGMGKTVLWEAGRSIARDRSMTVLTARPSEPERRYPYAALADLVRDVDTAAFDRLPAPQRQALRVAVLGGPDPGSGAHDYAVAAGFLSLATVIAADAPLLVAVDDIQWLDAASAAVLRHAVQRIDRTPLAFLFARRADPGEPPPDWLARPPAADYLRPISVGPLTFAEVELLLFSHLGRPLPRPVLRRIHEQAGGNALFSIEVGRALADGRRPEAVSVPEPLVRDVTALIDAELRRLPPATLDALSVVALISRPTEADIRAVLVAEPMSLLDAAVDAGIVLVQSHGRIEFTHPLRAAAAAAILSTAARRRLHRRIADTRTDLVQRAQHLALATGGRDGETASELERAAREALSRGAPATAAELAAAAWARTPDPDVADRRRRVLLEARADVIAGEPVRARELLEELLLELPPGTDRARARLELAGVLGDGIDVGAIEALTRLALAEAGDDVNLRIRCELQLAAISGTALPRLRQLVLEARPTGDQALVAAAIIELATATCWRTGRMPTRLLADALAIEPLIRETAPVRAWPRFVEAELRAITGDLPGALANYAALAVDAGARGDDDSLGWLLTCRVPIECALGQTDQAMVDAHEAVLMSRAAGQPQREAFALAGRALVAAHLGDEAAVRRDALAAETLTAGRPTPYAGPHASWAIGVLELALGRPEAAAARLGPLVDADDIVTPGDVAERRYAFDAIEALLRAGREDAAEVLLARCERAAGNGVDPESAASLDRCRGLILASRGDLAAARARLAAAADAYRRLMRPFLLGRTLLAFGACSRRARSKREAREALTAAADLFEALGSHLWAAEARAELGRVGGRGGSSGGLTEAERRVAGLVATGRSNRETAAALFISERTVESHLTAIYGKLGVRSRAGLASRMAGLRHRSDEDILTPG